MAVSTEQKVGLFFLATLILLAVYSFVFSTIFKARIPEAGDIGFVPYLAVAFWPWIAFSEAIVRSSTSISDGGVGHI